MLGGIPLTYRVSAMKIDWKFVSQTEGYQSLKTAVNEDKMRWHNTPNEVARMEGFFRKIIHQCHRVSEHTGIPIDIILSWAEHNRDHWYANYYNHCLLRIVGCEKQYRSKGTRKRPTTLRGVLKSRKRDKWYRKPRTREEHSSERRRIADISKRYKNP